MQQLYVKTSKTLDRLEKELNGWRIKLTVDSKQLDQLYQAVLDSYQELTAYLTAGHQKLNGIYRTEFDTLQAAANHTKTPESILASRDFANQYERFQKHLSDLELTKTAYLQTAIQIQLLRHTNGLLINQIQSSLSNSISIWQQSVIAAFTAQYDQAALELSNQTLLTTINDTLRVEQEGSEKRQQITTICRNQQTQFAL